MNIDNIIMYLRKSRSDDPCMTVEEVLAKHERILQEYAEKEYGARIPENHIYREVLSGETIADRPVIQGVLRLLEAGNTAAVLVIEPQRLSRGDLEDCGHIVNAFRYTNTAVATPSKTYNLSDEYDRKFFEMELTRGNDYLEYTKRILNRGRLASVKQGNYIGSVAPYGYRKVKIGTGKNASYTLEIVPEQADAVRLMFRLYIEGKGFTTIAKILDSYQIKPHKGDIWSPASISDMLENPIYIGIIRWNVQKTVKKIVDGKIVKSRPLNRNEEDVISVPGKHPAIIDQETFDAAMARRGLTPKIKRFNELRNPFAGLLFCQCGKAMSLKIYNQHTKSDKLTEVMLCNRQSACKTKSVMYSSFLDRIIEMMESAIADFEIKLSNQDPDSSKKQSQVIITLETKLDALKARDIRQKDAYEDGIYTKEEYAARNAKLQEEIAETTAAIVRAKEALLPEVDYREKILRFNQVLSALSDSSISATEKNLLLKSCIQRIEYHNEMPSHPGIGRWVDNQYSLDVFWRL